MTISPQNFRKKLEKGNENTKNEKCVFLNDSKIFVKYFCLFGIDCTNAKILGMLN